MKEISKASEKSSLLFDYYYGEDGVEAVSDDDIVAYVEENYLRYKVMSIEKTTDDDGNVTSDCTETYEEYLKKAQGGDFTRFDEVIDEYNASLETEFDMESLTEDSEVCININFEKLFKLMVEYKAEHLYTLPQWDGIYDAETKKRLTLEQKNARTVVKGEKIGRNDPCPCGSGKKYKKCCGANA